jgi:putative DNA primase/helicase
MSDDEPRDRKVANLEFWRETHTGQPRPEDDDDLDGAGAAPAAAETVADLRSWREARAAGQSKPKFEDDGEGDGGGGEPPDEGGGPPGGGGGAEPGPIWCSDDSLAVRLVNVLMPDWRYVAKWTQWLNWDGCRWVEDSKLGVFTQARRVCRGTAAIAAGTPGFLRGIDSAKTIAAAERLARSDHRVATEAEFTWDQDLFLLNTPGGIVDLRNGVLGPSNRDRLMMQVAGATPDGGCPNWRRFIDEITGGDQAYRDYLQRLIGYSLTGSTKEEIFAFLHGPSNTGKSKFVRTLELLHGTYGCNAPMDTFTATKAERHPTDLAGFVGKRLVTAAETEEGRRWDQQRLTTLTGGDLITARFMHGNFFKYTPQFLLVFHGNYRPRLANADEAMRRRMHLLPFRFRPAQIDRELLDKFIAELGGILVWAIEGAALWFRHGLKPPAIITNATNRYFAAENTMAAWIEDRCERSKPLTSLTRDLYRDYAGWAKAGNEFVLSERRFAETLEMLLGEDCEWKHPVNRRRGFRGIALRNRNEELPL